MLNENVIPMPELKPVRISTHDLSWWKKTVKYFERRKWEVTNDYLLFVPHLNKTILIPKGFIFDAASVPRLLWPIINPTGTALIPSMIHDLAYKYDCLLDSNKQKITIHEKDHRKVFDKLFRDIGVYVNGYTFVSDITYLALRMFGLVAWIKHRKVNSLIKDLI